MRLLDANILVYAHREDAVDHAFFNRWLTDLINGPEAFGVCDLVLSEFVRLVTHPRIFKEPSTLDEALLFVEIVRGQPQCCLMAPGPRHWAIFRELGLRAGARGNRVAGAYLAALAIESGSEWVTTDRDYARFPGLRWMHPKDRAA
jgi:toxin-antitoxin system PIN domain toxin